MWNESFRYHASPMHHQYDMRFKVDKIIEIRAAEGGSDAKLLVEDLGKAYTKAFQKLG